jgi:hypothetical protein
LLSQESRGLYSFFPVTIIEPQSSYEGSHPLGIEPLKLTGFAGLPHTCACVTPLSAVADGKGGAGNLPRGWPNHIIYLYCLNTGFVHHGSPITIAMPVQIKSLLSCFRKKAGIGKRFSEPKVKYLQSKQLRFPLEIGRKIEKNLIA